MAARKRGRQVARQRPRTLAERVAKLEELHRLTGEAIDNINRSVAMLKEGLFTLNDSLKANMRGGTETAQVLTSFLVALRDMMIAKGVITREEAIAFLEAADLRRMFEKPSKDQPASGGAQ